jgi:ABC-2 type transport system ATP-binding protein
MSMGVQTAAVRVEGLSRRYGTVRALDDVDLLLDRGITGLLGPNGAGKTTMLTVLATVNEPDDGQVSVFGLDPHDSAERVEIRRRLGYLPQELGYHRHFTVGAFLDYVAILKEVVDKRRRAEEVARVLAAVGLERSAGKRIRTLRGDSASASASPRRCSASPTCSSSTSRQPGWTPRSGCDSVSCYRNFRVTR